MEYAVRLILARMLSVFIKTGVVSKSLLSADQGLYCQCEKTKRRGRRGRKAFFCVCAFVLAITTTDVKEHTFDKAPVIVERF